MRNVRFYIDIAFCLLVLPVMAAIFPVERWFHNFPWYVIAVGSWLYGLYAVNRFFTVPALFRGGARRIYAAVFIVLSLVVTGLLADITLYPARPNIHDAGIVRLFPMIQQYQQAVWSLFMIVESFSFAVGLLTQADLQRSRRREVEARRVKAEMELYKAQIKPHFMFNTLNSLYGLFLTGSPKALESLEKFILMMRYIHTTSGEDFVLLGDEMDYIREYVDLQSLRLSETTRVSLDIRISNPALRFPPMLLVTFVENCFKHGTSPDEKSDIRISIVEQDGALDFSTSNRVFPVRRIGEHMGIENCRRRLDLLYPASHSLKISEEQSTFTVSLKIDSL